MPEARRRGLYAVLPACLAGAVLSLATAQPAWLRLAVPRGRPLADTVVTVPGRTLAPLVPALGLVGLAAVLALLGVRGWVRALLGWVIALAGVVLLVAAARHLAAPPPGTVADLLADHGPLPGRDLSRPVGASVRLIWPLLAALGGALLALAGAATGLRGARWPGMSGRYDAAGARPRAVATGSAHLWDALDRGDDPTG